jgi:Ca2+-binding RTX toxin-like protein
MAVQYQDVTLSPKAAGDTVTYNGTDANENILFDNPNDYLFNLNLDLNGGHDRVVYDGFSVADADIAGGPGNDIVELAAGGPMTAGGGSGDDRLDVYGDGDTHANGGAGNDYIKAGSTDFDTYIDGGTGNDEIHADTTGYYVGAKGGAGNDVIDAGLAGAIDVDGGDGNDRITGSADEDGIQALGGAGNDVIDVGGVPISLVNGGDGDDRISFTEEGSDPNWPLELYGGAGQDTIRYTTDKGDDVPVRTYGGDGKDQLYAGNAPDELHFLSKNTPAGKGRDVVHGFADGQDHLALDGDANLLRAGVQHYRFVGQTTHPGAGQVGFYHQGHDTIVDGFDGKTHFEVQLQGFHGHLDASDFIA